MLRLVLEHGILGLGFFRGYLVMSITMPLWETKSFNIMPNTLPLFGVRFGFYSWYVSIKQHQ